MASKIQIDEHKDSLGKVPVSEAKGAHYQGICRPYVPDEPEERRLDIIAEDHRKYSC